MSQANRGLGAKGTMGWLNRAVSGAPGGDQRQVCVCVFTTQIDAQGQSRCSDVQTHATLEPDTHQTHRFHTHAGSHTEVHAVLTQNCFPGSCRPYKGGDLGEMNQRLSLQPETLVCPCQPPLMPVHLDQVDDVLFPFL